MRRPLLASLAVILLAGCHPDATADKDVSGKSPAAKEAASEKAHGEIAKGDVEVPKDPAEKLREQIRSAAVQLNPAVDKIQEAYEAAKEIEKSPLANKEFKQALEDAISSLTDAGATLSDFTEEPPEIGEFKKDLPKYQKQKDAIISACNDAIHDLTDAMSTLDDVSPTAPPKLQNPLEGVTGAIDEALGTVRDALSGAGGKEEKLDDVPDAPEATTTPAK